MCNVMPACFGVNERALLSECIGNLIMKELEDMRKDFKDEIQNLGAKLADIIKSEKEKDVQNKIPKIEERLPLLKEKEFKQIDDCEESLITGKETRLRQYLIKPMRDDEPDTEDKLALLSNDIPETNLMVPMQTPSMNEQGGSLEEKIKVEVMLDQNNSLTNYEINSIQATCNSISNIIPLIGSTPQLSDVTTSDKENGQVQTIDLCGKQATSESMPSAGDSSVAVSSETVTGSFSPHHSNTELDKFFPGPSVCVVKCELLDPYNNFKNMPEKLSSYNSRISASETKEVLLQSELGPCRFRLNSCKENERSRKRRRKYKCPICERKFAKCATVRRHMTVHDKPKFDGGMECSACQRTFLSEIALQAHRNHCDEKLYYRKACNTSNKVKTEQDHKSERFQCKKCGKGFMLLRLYNAHKKEHVQTRFDSKICKKSFLFSKRLRAHLDILHSRPYFKCVICKKIFPTLVRLQAHTKDHVIRTRSQANCNPPQRLKI